MKSSTKTSLSPGARVNKQKPIQKARLHFSTDNGPWQDRNWTTFDARITDSQVSAVLPTGRPIVAFFTVEDENGAVASSPHMTIEK
jgi:hypothetical protein